MTPDFERSINHLAAGGVDRASIRTLFVPGRIEILGKHTDYCGGRSVVCALDRGFSIAYVPRTDARIRISAIEMPATAEFDLASTATPTIGTWTNYPLTAARRIALNFGDDLRGVDVAFTSTLPPAAGMSSSSALIVAMFLMLDEVNSLRERPVFRDAVHSLTELAEYLGTIENGQSYRSLRGDRGVGTFGGGEDHTAILLSRESQLGVYGFSPLAHERDVAMPDQLAIVIASSGVIAEKTGAARQRYNDISLRVRALVSLWNNTTAEPATTLGQIIRSSPDANDRLLAAIRFSQHETFSRATLEQRLTQFVAESEIIIPAAVDALARGDLQTFGKEVDHSQRLAETLLHNQVPETIALTTDARALGAVASSAFGAGFGGSVWAMVDRSAAQPFCAEWQARYQSFFPQHAPLARFFVTRPARGAMPSSGLADIGLAGRLPLVGAE